MGDEEQADGLGVFRGLRAALGLAVLGQDGAMDALSDALLAGELGHGSPGRPRSLILVLGPTGTGKTRSVLAASAHLFGEGGVARVNCAEFSSAERVPLLLGRGRGEDGLLGLRICAARARGGRILLLDEIEKAHPSVADHLLGIEEASLTTAGGELDLSDMHVIATSNVGSSGVIEMDSLPPASVRRYVEQAAASQFRPEVLARFTAVLVFRHLPREVQVGICSKMLGDELRHQSAVLSRAFGHPHEVTADPAVCRVLVSEGWHRRLGARPMRNVVERRLRGALVEGRLAGVLAPGVPASVIVAGADGGLRAQALSA
ncbi:MAG TPA: AAA family ATPase [Opitutaceae bacterium]|jgi:ATP-dependent Clp protease ATP-binding subunit ClpB